MGAVCAVLFLALCVWAAVSPRSMWWTTTAWRYRDPASNEPSDAAYLMTRIGGIVVVAVVAITSVVTVTRPDGGSGRSERPRATPTARAADTGPLLRALGGNHKSVRVEAREIRPYWSLRMSQAAGRADARLRLGPANQPKALWAAAGSVDLSTADLAVVVPGECPVDVYVSEGTGGGVTGVTVALVVGAAPEPPDRPPPGAPTPSVSSGAPSGGSSGAPGAGASPSAGAACTGDPGSLVVLALDLVTSSTPDREVWDEAIGTPTKQLPVT